MVDAEELAKCFDADELRGRSPIRCFTREERRVIAAALREIQAESPAHQAAKIWTEFVAHCEAIEADADGELLRASDEKERQFCRGQAWAAKSIRRAVTHPKYR